MLSDLALRILTMLPKATNRPENPPCGVTQNDIRTDIRMDLHIPDDAKPPKIGAALSEIEDEIGLTRMKTPHTDGEKKGTMYGIPNHSWPMAKKLASAWWDANMRPATV